MNILGLNKKKEVPQRIGLFFGSSTGNSHTIARIIAEKFHPIEIEVHDVMTSTLTDILPYDRLIFGVPTWNRKELHEDWKEFLPRIEQFNFRKKKVALYGLGDQHTYKENFLDGMGLVYEWLQKKGTQIVGFWPIEGYSFVRSGALRDGKFVGLAIDEDFQSDRTQSRTEKWVNQLKKEFEI